MSTIKIVKKIQKIGGFNPITVEGNRQVTALFNHPLSDVKMSEIVKAFPLKKYQFTITTVDQKLKIDISKSLYIRTLSRRAHYDMADAMHASLFSFDAANMQRDHSSPFINKTQNPK